MGKKAKADKPKFPKRLGGIKVPKPLRRTGTGLVRFASTPLGSAIVADLMIAGAARIVRDRHVQSAAMDAGAGARRVGSNIAEVVASAAAAAAAPILSAAHNARGPKRAADPSDSEQERNKPAKPKPPEAAPDARL